MRCIRRLKFMKVFIFGAGASYDAISDLDNGLRMPLTKDLFLDEPTLNRVLLDNPSASLAVDEIRENLASNSAASVEVEIEKLRVRAQNDPHLARSLLGILGYLKNIINIHTTIVLNKDYQRTNYRVLLRKLMAWQVRTSSKVLLVSFNYDTLLDSACQLQVSGWRVKDAASMEVYTAREDFKLLKLHGSVNWNRIIPTPEDFNGDIYDYTDKIDMSTSRLMAPSESIPQGYTAMPAIALPMSTKSNFECPDSFISELKIGLGKATDIVLIGWRGAEPHFKEAMQNIINPKTMLTIVTGSAEGGNDALKNLEWMPTTNKSRYDKGFSDFINSVDLKTILSRP